MVNCKLTDRQKRLLKIADLTQNNNNLQLKQSIELWALQKIILPFHFAIESIHSFIWFKATRWFKTNTPETWNKGTRKSH